MSYAGRNQGTTNGGPQTSGAERVFDKLCRTRSDDVDRHAQIVFSADDYDRETKLTSPDFVDEAADAYPGKIHGCDDASAGTGAERCDQLLGAAGSSYVECRAGQSPADLAAFTRRGCDDVDGIAQLSLHNRRAKRRCGVRAHAALVPTTDQNFPGAPAEWAPPTESAISGTT